MGMRTWQSISVPLWTHKDLLMKKLAWPRAETSQGHPKDSHFWEAVTHRMVPARHGNCPCQDFPCPCSGPGQRSPASRLTGKQLAPSPFSRAPGRAGGGWRISPGVLGCRSWGSAALGHQGPPPRGCLRPHGRGI